MVYSPDLSYAVSILSVTAELNMNIPVKLLASLLLATPLAFAAAPSATLYKSPSCGCCGEYVKYLRANGIEVKAVDSNEMDKIKQDNKVGNLGSCHTMLIGGYVVEGHVPVTAINKLLQQKPKIIGISAPGMPPNSPGMGEMKPGTLKIYQISGNEKDKPKLFSVE